MKKNRVQTHFFTTEEEKESLKELAWQHKMNVSDFIKYCLKQQGVEIEEK